MKTQALIQISLIISAISITSVRGLTCLQCENILHPRHCHTVVRCEANEECFTTYSLATQRYHLGCRRPSMCRRDGGHNGTSCNDCCSSDLCNAHGCQESGYPLVRGPVCYDCSYHDEQHPCTNIDVCSIDEECSILSKDEFGDIILTSGCRPRHICHSTGVQPSSIIGRRSVQDKRSSSQILCNKCCSHDLCNLNCSIDYCHSSPCQQGSCSTDGSSYKCHCFVGWTGLQCEKHIDFCRASPCINGKCINLDSGYHCDCTPPTHGKVCEGTYHDCLEIKQNTLNRTITDGIYKIQLKTKQIIDVYCDMTTDGGGWVVFQKRFNGSEDFYRNFSDYENGFGSLEGEFWLGLKYVYQLLENTITELRLDLEDANGATAYQVYQNFSLTPSPSYRLHIGRSSGTAGDNGNGLSYNDDIEFSTFDHGPIQRCPLDDRGGWWYESCTWANLNGDYGTPGTVSSYHSGEGGMTYYAWKNHRSLKTSEMKLRRK